MGTAAGLKPARKSGFFWWPPFQSYVAHPFVLINTPVPPSGLPPQDKKRGKIPSLVQDEWRSGLPTHRSGRPVLPPRPPQSHILSSSMRERQGEMSLPLQSPSAGTTRSERGWDFVLSPGSDRGQRRTKQFLLSPETAKFNIKLCCREVPS